jgi:glutaredoxin
MSTREATVQTATLKVPGATLYYEVRGSGPILLCISGGPTDAGMFADLAGRLADRYTVVTYDQRGHSRSMLDGEPEDIPVVAVHADRAEGVMAAMGKFGAIVEEGGPRYSEEMQRTPPTPEGQEMMGRMAGNFDLFIAHELQLNGSYLPDLDAPQSAATRIVSAAGENSGEQAARRSAIALAERLGVPVIYLSGAHGGWGSDPQEFAERLHEVLRGG